MQNNNSSKTIGIVIIVIIILLGVWLMTRRSAPATVNTVPETPTATTTTAPAAQAPAQDPALAGIQSSGASDAGLQSDSVAIDSQMQSFASDNTAAQSAQ